jgi:hypothetical protein
MALNSYADVQNHLNNVIAQLGSNIGRARHGAFWNSLTYQQFITGNVTNISRPPGDPPNANGTWKILVVGQSANSNIIKALEGNPPFDGTIFPQMPADGPPYFTQDQIQPLADWIDAKCPNPGAGA